MRTNPYQNYLENEILTADPLKLVVFLYRGAIDSIACARRHLASGDIRARSQSITKVMEILAELILSLNMETGGELSLNLARLYDYTLGLVIAANTGQIDAPLAEAELLLQDLLSAWVCCLPTEAALPSSEDTFEDAPIQRLVSCAY